MPKSEGQPGVRLVEPAPRAAHYTVRVTPPDVRSPDALTHRHSIRRCSAYLRRGERELSPCGWTLYWEALTCVNRSAELCDGCKPAFSLIENLEGRAELKQPVSGTAAVSKPTAPRPCGQGT
jgi:hypothetical protein